MMASHSRIAFAAELSDPARIPREPRESGNKIVEALVVAVWEPNKAQRNLCKPRTTRLAIETEQALLPRVM